MEYELHNSPSLQRLDMCRNATTEIFGIFGSGVKTDAEKEIEILKINILLIKKLIMIPNEIEVYDRLNRTLKILTDRLQRETYTANAKLTDSNKTITIPSLTAASLCID